MRSAWTRAGAPLALERPALTALIQAGFPGSSVIDSVPAAGGLSNSNFRLVLSGRTAPILLRLFTRHPDRAALEIALMERVAQLVPVPAVLHFARENAVTGHPCALLDWVDGTRLELAFPAASAGERVAMGEAIGTMLARLHSLTFPTAGFLDETLGVVRPITFGSEGLISWLRHCLLDGIGAERLGGAATERLLRFAETQGRLLDAWTGPFCLAHGDCGGSNILMRRLSVAALLDWEYAFSGSPFVDLGNLLRPPLGDAADFVTAVARGYRDAGGVLPDNWLSLARITDLYSWADFLIRDDAGEAVIADARTMIERIMAHAG